MTIIKKIIIIIVSILIILCVWFLWKYFFLLKETAAIGKEYLLSIITIQKSQIRPPPFERAFSGMKNSLPFVAAIAIDVNNDGKESIFIGGGENQDDVLLDYIDGKLVNNIKGTGLSSKVPTHGGVSIDMDNDGYSDMIIAREDGVTLYINNKNGTFSKKKILEAKDDRVPIAITVADFNKDGEIDIYISNFIKSKDLKNYQHNNPAHSKENVLLENIGKYEFNDVTNIYGVGGEHNTFTSIFSDLNNDGHPDLVVANDAGKIAIYENKNGEFIGNKNRKFVKRDVDMGHGFWMGIAAGDFDNDGDIDLFLSNVSRHVPEESGQTVGTKETGIRKHQKLNHSHVLLRNDGNFKFVNVYDKYFKKYYGFGWGSVFEDINMDGKLDLLFGVNYMNHPLHKYIRHTQPVLMNRGKDKPFKQVYNYADTGLGHTPLLVDVDNDGIKDVIWVNIKGPLKIYANDNKNNNNYINVKLPSNYRFINAKVIAYADDGTKQMRENIQGGVGFGSDQSEIHSFGLGKNKVRKIVVNTIYGDTFEYDMPKTNSTLFVTMK